eukprot:Em0006g1171a
MATLTATVQKPFVRPSRTYDYLYDPNHSVSSYRDHAKENFKAQASMDRIKMMPNYKAMFSCLRHYPRNYVTLDSTDPIPQHVDRQWRGYADQARENLVTYKTLHYAPFIRVPPKKFETVEVEGKDRPKFFRRPVIPFLPQLPPNVLLAPTSVDPLVPPTTENGGSGEATVPATRSVFVQTDYRDSDVQTDPYSPEYVVRPGSQPELLTLATLCYKQGLPAGLAEVEMIERAREKRAWEATLPPLSDTSQLEKRRRMMEEQERKEWAFREQEIEELQQERLKLLKAALARREANLQKLNERRLEHLWSKRQAEKEQKIRRIRSEHVKALRQLTAKRAKVEGRKEPRDIVQEYTKFDSQVYAPMTRIGVYLDGQADNYHVSSIYTSTLEGLLDLEAALPKFITDPRIRSPSEYQRNKIGVKACQSAKLGRILEQVHNELLQEKNSGSRSPKPLRFLEKVEKPVPRPPTPTVDAPTAESEEVELAVILLQRVLRGRAIQTKMFEGKERRKDLIGELRTTHALQAPEQKEKRRQNEEVLSLQHEREALEHKEQVLLDATETGPALLVGEQLDFLSKELQRLHEERRIHAFVMLAERQRRMREAEESGQRQREERVRRIEDEVFKQMMTVHQCTVDQYLEDVILQSVERNSDDQSREEVRKQADLINSVAHEVEHTELSGKELVAEMVYTFLLPEVERQTVRERVRRHQQRHLLAAHTIIHKEMDGQQQGAGGSNTQLT